MGRFFILLAGLVLAALAQSDAKKRIFILHSYSQEYGWTKLQHEGFVERIAKGYPHPVEIAVEYLDTKRLVPTPEYQERFAGYLSYKYRDFSPDVWYVTDDDALRFALAARNGLFAQVPVVFSGVNDESVRFQLDPRRDTGVFERKEIAPNVELIRQFSPQTREIWIVGDTSGTYRAIEADLKSSLHRYPNYRFHFVSSERLAEILAALPAKKRSFVILTTIGGWRDARGNLLTPEESLGAFKNYPHLVLCSMEDAYVSGGVIGGYVTSGTNQGREAANLVLRLFGGEKIAFLSPILKSPNEYRFDQKALSASRVVLSEYVRRQAVILNPDQTLLERHAANLMNLLFLFSFGAFVAGIIVYFLLREKNHRIRECENDRRKQQQKSGRDKVILSLMGSGGRSAYWVWDAEEEKLVFSDLLCQWLPIPKHRFDRLEDLCDLLNADNDGELRKGLIRLREGEEEIRLEHTLISSEAEKFGVVHTLCRVYEGDSVSYVGVLARVRL